MSPRLFHVLGTDTDVGKTYVTHLLLKVLAKRGIRAISVKPVHSGWPEDVTWGEDLEMQRELWSNDLDVETACAYAIPAAMSPHYASYLVDRQIELETLKKWSEKLLKIDVDVILIEGVGGICCPLAKQLTYLDYLKTFPQPSFIVGRVGLGALNHAIMSENMLSESNCNCIAFLLNEERVFEKDDLIASSAKWELEHQMKSKILGPMKHGDERQNNEVLNNLVDLF